VKNNSEVGAALLGVGVLIAAVAIAATVYVIGSEHMRFLTTILTVGIVFIGICGGISIPVYVYQKGRIGVETAKASVQAAIAYSQTPQPTSMPKGFSIDPEHVLQLMARAQSRTQPTLPGSGYGQIWPDQLRQVLSSNQPPPMSDWTQAPPDLPMQ
jgi:hypothetical protein